MLLSTLKALQAFFTWLSQQQGFKSRFSYLDAAYFALSRKETAIAQAPRGRPIPSIEQIRHVILSMPSATDIEKRDRALLALAIMSGARADALASLRFSTSISRPTRFSRTRATCAQNSRRPSKPQIAAPIKKFSVFHGARERDGMQSQFRLWQTSYSPATQRWVDKEYNIIGDRSYFVHIDGTGRNMIENSAKTWMGTGAESTSRAAVWSFCEALERGADPFSGGVPQIVGIWRKGVGRNFGVIWKGKRFLSGLEVKGEAVWDRVDWFNERFERCSGETGILLEGAQPQPKPLRIVREENER